jgi:membrane protein DedA with SNARE-associated domain
VNELLSLLSRYGYLLILANLFLESVGLPIPAAPILIAAGAAAAFGSLKILNVLTIALAACMLGDLLLFLAGRYTGWAILGFLCRLSVNPETCILRSAESFYKRGRLTLVFSKFIPGINTMAPPMSGSMNMRLAEFLGLDLLAASLYISLFAGLGFFFSHLVTAIADGIASLRHVFYWSLLLGLVVYSIYRLRNYWKSRLYRNVARVSVQDLAAKLGSSEGAANALVADTRSHGYYDRGAMRIRGSVRLDPNAILEEMNRLPKEKEIYLYCT